MGDMLLQSILVRKRYTSYSNKHLPSVLAKNIAIHKESGSGYSSVSLPVGPPVVMLLRSKMIATLHF